MTDQQVETAMAKAVSDVMPLMTPEQCRDIAQEFMLTLGKVLAETIAYGPPDSPLAPARLAALCIAAESAAVEKLTDDGIRICITLIETARVVRKGKAQQ